MSHDRLEPEDLSKVQQLKADTPSIYQTNCLNSGMNEPYLVALNPIVSVTVVISKVFAFPLRQI